MTSSSTPLPHALLQSNVTAFFERFADKHANAMQCLRQCSRCCHVDLAVLPGEAIIIARWWGEQSPDTRSSLKQLWQNAPGEMGKDAAGHERPACVFLARGLCAIYPARPIICRSQGAVLLLPRPEGETTAATSGENPEPPRAPSVDVCPLNFATGEPLPPAREWLDLARLNTLLAIAESAIRTLPEFGSMMVLRNDEGRVPLSALRQFLVEHPPTPSAR